MFEDTSNKRAQVGSLAKYFEITIWNNDRISHIYYIQNKMLIKWNDKFINIKNGEILTYDFWTETSLSIKFVIFPSTCE